MTLKVNNVHQIDEGGTNPKSELFEQPIWELEFEGTEERRIVGKNKMEEYLSKAYEKTVHQFKRWKITTNVGSEFFNWVIVFTDKSHEVCIDRQLREKLYQGHVRKDEEKYRKLDEELISKRGLVAEAIVKATEYSQQENYHRVTTPDDKKKVEDFRDKVRKEENLEGFHDLISKDAAPHPDAEGWTDKK